MSLTLAGGYVVSLVSIYYLFVRWYRHRKTKAVQQDPSPWFPDHPTREAYFDLISQDSLPPTKQLKTALLKRAMTNVYRIWSLREDRSTLSMLLRNGAIGDDLWNEFLTSEVELNEEIMECVNEAEELERGWGKSLFQQASEMCVLEKQRQAQKERKQAEQALKAQEKKQKELTAIQQEAARKKLEQELILEEEEEKKKKSKVVKRKK